MKGETSAVRRYERDAPLRRDQFGQVGKIPPAGTERR